MQCPSLYTPEKETFYLLYRRLGGPQGRCGQVWKISPTLGFVQHNIKGWLIRLLTNFKTSMNKTHLQNGYNKVEHPTMNFIYNHTSNPKKVCTQFVRSRQSKQLVRMVPFCSLQKQKMLHINVHKWYALREKLHISVHKTLHISVHERYTVKQKPKEVMSSQKLAVSAVFHWMALIYWS